jgi:uncharacterized protein (DUF4415 family)
MPRTRQPKPAEGRTDWAKLRALSDDEIERAARDDIDNPPTDEAHWADARIGLPPLKTAVNAKFDADVVEWFKAQGRGYQTRMNAVLRLYMEAQRKKAG